MEYYNGNRASHWQLTVADFDAISDGDVQTQRRSEGLIELIVIPCAETMLFG